MLKTDKDFFTKLNLQFFGDEGQENDNQENGEVKDNQETNGNSSNGTQDKPKLEELLKDNDFAKEVQSLLDKRVTEALKKQERKLKEKFEEEKKKAQMTEEEREAQRQKEFEEAQRQKELQLKAREYKLDLIDILEEEQLDTAFRDLIDVSTVLHIEDRDEALTELKDKVKKLKSIFEKVVNKQVEELKQEYLKGNTPNNVGRENNNTPLNEYEKAKKNRDVKAMIASKFAKRQ